jgi:hypothetical protein
MTDDWTIPNIRNYWHAAWQKQKLWAIVETPAGFEVHEHSPTDVAPPSVYPTRRLAASRVLQLLGIGPVAPQSHPEEVCIGYVEAERDGP